MKKIDNDNWFEKLKLDIVNLVLFLKDTREDTVCLLCTNTWITQDINFCESFSHLQDMLEISSSDLDKLIILINNIENNNIIFNKNDLLDEFDYIKENINLELSYFLNMLNYINIIMNPFINGNDITDMLEEYLDISGLCYNQMKINNDQLKQLRKERRDLN